MCTSHLFWNAGDCVGLSKFKIFKHIGLQKSHRRRYHCGRKWMSTSSIVRFSIYDIKFGLKTNWNWLSTSLCTSYIRQVVPMINSMIKDLRWSPLSMKIFHFFLFPFFLFIPQKHFLPRGTSWTTPPCTKLAENLWNIFERLRATWRSVERPCFFSCDHQIFIYYQSDYTFFFLFSLLYFHRLHKSIRCGSRSRSQWLWIVFEVTPFK